MTSNIPWFKLALLGTFVGVSALIGYAAVTRNVFTTTAEESEPAEKKETSQSNLANKAKSQKKKKPKKKTSSASSSKSKSISSVNEDPFGNALALIENDVSVLNKLPSEIKQQVFYILLIRGETMIKEATAGDEKEEEEIISKAVEYFVKAVGLVSQPAEVLMSYEQMLPEDIFKRIILALQNSNLEKTRVYFESLRSESGLVRFELVDGPETTSPTAKSSESKEWAAVLAGESAISEGTVLMSEEPDVAMCTLKADACCDFCFKTLTEIEEICHLADLSYCSTFCQSQARESYGKYIENLSATAGYAYQQLVKVVHETKIYAPLLLLRYIASLLEDELMKQKENSDAFDNETFHLFAHYDYLRPAYRVPRDSDKAEAVLIRTILQPAHKDISEFLSDEIYVAMKSTVMFNGIGNEIKSDANKAEEAEFTEESKISVNSEPFKNDNLKLKSLEPIRNSGNTAKSDFFGLYHSFAHISHSCDPNCQLIADENVPRRLKLVARRSINPEEKLTISFTGIDGGCAKEALETDFYIKCTC